MKIAIRHRITKKFGRVDPTPVAGKTGDDQFPVNFDRDKAAGHETIDLTKDGDRFFATFIDSKRRLSLGNDGKWQTRKDGTNGSWESMRATVQPDGPNFLYRREGEALVDVVEFVEVS